MSVTLTSDLGNITIDESVLANIAGIAASECYGIIGMNALTAGSKISGAFKGENPGKGIM
ncbi:MAG: Asp23/Gls24 family envelope stress response protein, partial [Sporomusa sp.]